MPTSTPAAAIAELAASLRALKADPGSLPALYVGEFASLTPGGLSWREELERRVLLDLGRLSPDSVQTLSPADRSDRFSRLWANTDPPVRRVVMRTVIEGLRSPGAGHQALADLLKEGCFRLVLTGNPDGLIEDALGASGVRTLDYYRIVNQLDQHAAIQAYLGSGNRKFVIFKLIGDFGTADLKATEISLHQIQTAMDSVRSVLTPFLQVPLVIAGAGPYDDPILRYFPTSGDHLGKVTYSGIAASSTIEELFYARHVSPVVAPEMTFDMFCPLLTESVNGREAGAAPPHTPDTIVPPVKPADQASVPSPAAASVRPAPAARPAIFPPLPSGPTETPPTSSPLVSLDVDVSFEVMPVTVFNVDVDTHQHISFRLSGGRKFKSDESLPWTALDVTQENIYMQQMGMRLLYSYQRNNQEDHDIWRALAKQKGIELMTSLETAHPDLAKQLAAAMYNFDGYQLTLCFNGPPEHLNIPYELLYQRNTPLATRYPLCRHVTGTHVRSRNFAQFIQNLRSQKSELRVLLIASNVDNTLTVDEEIEAVAAIIQGKAKAIGLKVSIERLSSERATLNAVREKLSGCKSHIVHFAGHGSFDAQAGENSCIYLRTGGLLSRSSVAALTAHQIAQSLREPGTDTQLVYLSACVSAASGTSAQLRSYDCLGMLDAVVRAEIPYVLGYRWPVTDRGSNAFARLFYERLLDGLFVPEQSVMEVRKTLYTTNPMDETWASSILVAQHVYDN